MRAREKTQTERPTTTTKTILYYMYIFYIHGCMYEKRQRMVKRDVSFTNQLKNKNILTGIITRRLWMFVAITFA